MTAARLIEIPCKHIASILEVHCKLGVLVKYNWFQTSVHYVEKQQAKFGVVNEVRIRHKQTDKQLEWFCKENSLKTPVTVCQHKNVG